MMLWLFSTALGATLSLSPAEQQTLVADCLADDVDACLTMATEAERAWAWSWYQHEAHSLGVGDDTRLAQAQLFRELACERGHTDSCPDVSSEVASAESVEKQGSAPVFSRSRAGIIGIVRSGDDKVPFADVVVTDGTGEQIWTGQTDEDGGFVIRVDSAQLPWQVVVTSVGQSFFGRVEAGPTLHVQFFEGIRAKGQLTGPDIAGARIHIGGPGSQISVEPAADGRYDVAGPALLELADGRMLKLSGTQTPSTTHARAPWLIEVRGCEGDLVEGAVLRTDARTLTTGPDGRVPVPLGRHPRPGTTALTIGGQAVPFLPEYISATRISRIRAGCKHTLALDSDVQRAAYRALTGSPAPDAPTAVVSLKPGLKARLGFADETWVRVQVESPAQGPLQPVIEVLDTVKIKVEDVDGAPLGGQSVRKRVGKRTIETRTSPDGWMVLPAPTGTLAGSVQVGTGQFARKVHGDQAVTLTGLRPLPVEDVALRSARVVQPCEGSRPKPDVVLIQKLEQQFGVPYCSRKTDDAVAVALAVYPLSVYAHRADNDSLFGVVCGDCTGAAPGMSGHEWSDGPVEELLGDSEWRHARAVRNDELRALRGRWSEGPQARLSLLLELDNPQEQMRLQKQSRTLYGPSGSMSSAELALHERIVAIDEDTVVVSGKPGSQVCVRRPADTVDP